MGRKNTFTAEQKICACEEYLSGRTGATEIARQLGLGRCGDDRVRYWAKRYTAQGAAAFTDKAHNASYSKEFKERVVQEYLTEGISIEDLAVKWNIPSEATVSMWIFRYNSHREQQDYDPHPEVYMAKQKKTTLEERIQIVEYCLSHGRNYAAAAEEFGCSYDQVYSWVRKYGEHGEEGLIDKRGRRKPEEELSDLEITQRKLKAAEQKIERLKAENDFLKKLQEIERR